MKPDRTVEVWNVRDGDVTCTVYLYECINDWGQHIGYHYEVDRSDGVLAEVKTVGPKPLDRMREFARRYAASNSATWELAERSDAR